MENVSHRSPILGWYFDDLLGKGDKSRADEFIVDDMIFHPLPLRGRATFLDYVAVLRSAFPDLNFRIDDEVENGSKVAARFTMTGTHLGEFRGIPATGKKFEVAGMDLLHIKDGRISDIWVSLDSLEWMQQLGVISLPE
jgi:steroid delta-isomerase-like uncharacterized protein